MREMVSSVLRMLLISGLEGLQIMGIVLAVKLWYKRAVLKELDEVGLNVLVMLLAVFPIAVHALLGLAVVGKVVGWSLVDQWTGRLFPRGRGVPVVYLIVMFILLICALCCPKTQACPESFLFRLVMFGCSFLAWFIVTAMS